MKKVEVFMSTYNGEKYLREQIDSILNQVGVEIRLTIRDDGSTDETRNILHEYENYERVRILYGKNIYLTKSFFTLVNNTDGESDYYAFADQDDVWCENKLCTAVSFLEQNAGDRAAVYYSSLEVVDSELNYMYTISKSFNNFATSLVINEVAGCTMVFNRKLLQLNKKYSGENARMHDHWFYLLCLAVHGYVYCDSDSYILYRQHSNNSVGGIKSQRRRVHSLMTSCFQRPNERINQIYDLYDVLDGELDKETDQIFRDFLDYRNSLYNKIRLLLCKNIKLDMRRRVLFTLSILMRKF